MQIVAVIFKRNPLLAWLGLLNLILFLLALMLFSIDHRLVNGINTWVKPMKFALTLWIYLWTLAWLLYDLPQKKQVKAICWIIVISLIVEQGLIFFQASRGVASHFNISTAFNLKIFNLMGVAILVNTFAVIWAAILYFFPIPGVSLSYVWAVRIGFVVFLFASLEGGYMASKLSHYIGTQPEGNKLPFLNWSRTGGDLRIAHFIGLHALQVLPLLGWAISKRRISYPVTSTIIISLLYFVLTVFLFWRASNGFSNI